MRESRSSSQRPELPRAEFIPHDAHVYDRRSPGRWFLSHVLRYWPLVAYVALASLVFTSLRSYIPLEVGRAFEVVSVGGTLQELESIAVAIVVIAVIQSLINLSSAYANEAVAQRIERDAREELVISLLAKSQTFHDRQRVGDIMARATNDVKQLNLMMSPGLILIYQSLIGLIVPLVLVAAINWKLLLSPVLFVVLAGMALKRYMNELGPLSSRMRTAFGAMNSSLNEILVNARLVRNFVQTEREKAAFAREVRVYRDVFVEQGDVQARYLPLLVLGGVMSLGLMHALMLAEAGELSYGEVVGFMGVLTLLRFPTFISIFSFNLVQLGLASAARVLETITADTEIDHNSVGHDAVIEGHIAFEGVSFRYQEDGPWVLRDIQFSVSPGQRVAVVGPTGSGKTTLIKLLQRLYDVQEGRVLVEGIPVTEWNLERLRSQIGVIEQDTFLFSRSVAENIAFGRPGASPDQIEAVARAAQAHDFISSFEKGYANPVGARGLTLSGGQKQRLAIARALLTRPAVLALDDATSAVDSATEDSLQQALRHLTAGRTAFIITHRLAQIRHADLILFMKRGRIIAQGNHEYLIRTCLEYREIFEVYGARLPPLEAACS